MGRQIVLFGKIHLGYMFRGLKQLKFLLWELLMHFETSQRHFTLQQYSW